MSENTCKACGEECNVVTIDTGIGAYEYWGASGYDSRPAVVSECCESDFDGPEPEPEFDYYDDERV